MGIQIIFIIKKWAGKPGPFKAHITFKGPLSNPAHMYLRPTRPLSGPLNTPRRNTLVTMMMMMVSRLTAFTWLH